MPARYRPRWTATPTDPRVATALVALAAGRAPVDTAEERCVVAAAAAAMEAAAAAAAAATAAAVHARQLFAATTPVTYMQRVVGIAMLARIAERLARPATAHQPRYRTPVAVVAMTGHVHAGRVGVGVGVGVDVAGDVAGDADADADVHEWTPMWRTEW